MNFFFELLDKSLVYGCGQVRPSDGLQRETTRGLSCRLQDRGLDGCAPSERGLTFGPAAGGRVIHGSIRLDSMAGQAQTEVCDMRDRPLMAKECKAVEG
jgi:hypothetical protein